MLRIICFTPQGYGLAEKIAGRMPAEVYRKFHTEEASGWTPGQTEEALAEAPFTENKKCPFVATEVTVPLSAWAAEGFTAGDPLLFIGAAGIAVRAIAGCVRDKLTDVPVLVMDVLGDYVIPILSGHVGGANALAAELSEITGAVPVITTATDRTGAFAADLFAKEYGMRIQNPKALPRVSGRAVAGAKIRIAWQEGAKEPAGRILEQIRGICGVPEGTCMVSPEEPADIRITLGPLPADILKEKDILYLTPRCLYAGIGCRKDIPAGQLEAFVREQCENLGLDAEALAGIASIDVKKKEPAILSLAKGLGIPFRTYTAEELREVPGDFPDSAFVEEQVGVGEVSGRAAMCLAGREGWLILPKAVGQGITFSLACNLGDRTV